MKKVTLKALKASIKHWEEDDGHMEGGNCALCRRFVHVHNPKAGHCCIKSTGEKCPVYAKTGKIECEGTPYRCLPTTRQRKAEIKFLKSLLPE